MNFTVGLVGGLILLFPGICAAAGWNFRGAGEGASRPELPLNSVSVLFAVLGISMSAHLLGFGATRMLWAAAGSLGQWLPPRFPHWPATADPYAVLWTMLERGDASRGGGPSPVPALDQAWVLAPVLVAECLLCWRLAQSEGLDLVLEGADVRSQGWVYQNVVLPKRNGYEPFAYVLTSPPQGEFGLGYQGIVVEIRQGADGEVKTICLGEPQAFVYEIKRPGGDTGSRARIARAGGAPRLVRHSRRWIGGVVTLEASAIRNIVIHNIPQDLMEDLAAQLGVADDAAVDDVRSSSTGAPAAAP